MISDWKVRPLRGKPEMRCWSTVVPTADSVLRSSASPRMATTSLRVAIGSTKFKSARSATLSVIPDRSVV